MYFSFFGLNENPFNLTPDPRYLFLSPIHKEAFNHLLYGINERKGFIVVTGGIGTGKTTMCRVLLDHLDSGAKSALIFNSYVSDIELLKTINQEFGIEMSPEPTTKKEYIDKLNHFLLDNFKNGGNAIVLIDEAQNLARDVLEQIRMLSNLETEREKLIQIVLVGQPELRELLASPSLKQLDERITIRYDLNPLAFRDIRGYIEHRLIVAGGRGDLKFTKSALKKIYTYSRGNPRRINSLCDRALIIAYTKEKHIITGKIVLKAIKDLHRNLIIKKTFSKYQLRYISSSILMILLILIAGFLIWNFRVEIKEYLYRDNIVTGVKQVNSSPPLPPDSEPVIKTEDLTLDEHTSLSGLFALQNMLTKERKEDTIGPVLTLVQFDLRPEFYITLKKPFRVLVKNEFEDDAKDYSYLLVEQTNYQGAVVINKKGEERDVSRTFILKNWGNKVSWVYPITNRDRLLSKGKNTPEVMQIQKILNKIGYIVKPTGVYDDSTFDNIMKFQKDFGLSADGIAGPRTMALLFQMVGWDELY